MDHAAVWQASGKTFVGFIKSPNFGPASAAKAVAAAWIKGTEKGKTIYSLKTIPSITGYKGMQATSANTSGRIIGVVFDEYGKLYSWFAKPKK